MSLKQLTIPSDSVSEVSGDVRNGLFAVAMKGVDMVLPPLAERSDIRPFAEHLLSMAPLWDLVSSFGAGEGGLAQRQRDLAEAILNKQFDSDATEHQAGRVLANWTLADAVTGPPPSTAPVAERLAWLKGFAARRWDFRVGRERDFIPTSLEMLSAPVALQVHELARAWGMLTPEPAYGEYDHVIVLGGLLRANFNRPMAAAEMITAGSVRTQSVVGLGAPRPMSQGELELGRSIGCGANNEQSALEEGLERAFQFTSDQWQATASPNMRSAKAPSGITVRSAGAPLNPDGTRENTGGAFGWFMRESDLVRDGQRVLSVTTPIYWIAGHLSLMTRMPPHAELTTIGADPARALPGLTQIFRSQHYLQEIKTTVDVLSVSLAS